MKLYNPTTNRTKTVPRMTKDQRREAHEKYLKDQAEYLKSHRGYRMQGQ